MKNAVTRARVVYTIVVARYVVCAVSSGRQPASNHSSSCQLPICLAVSVRLSFCLYRLSVSEYGYIYASRSSRLLRRIYIYSCVIGISPTPLLGSFPKLDLQRRGWSRITCVYGGPKCGVVGCDVKGILEERRGWFLLRQLRRPPFSLLRAREGGAEVVYRGGYRGSSVRVGTALSWCLCCICQEQEKWAFTTVASRGGADDAE